MISQLNAAAAAMLEPAPSAPPGCVLGVARDDERHVVAAGLADPDGTPMNRGTLLDLASVTKVVGTATALNRLVGEGLLDLDAEVACFVPGFHPGVSVADLLRHRGGLAAWQPLYLAPAVRAAEGTRQRRDAALATVLSLPLAQPPGRAALYSDLGFIVAGQVVEAVTGLELDAAVDALVNGPFGTRFAFGPVAGPAITTSIGDAWERRMVATREPYPVLWPEDGFEWREAPVSGRVNDGNSFHALGGVGGHAGLFGAIDDLLDLGVRLARADDEQEMGWRRCGITVAGRALDLLWHPGFTGTALGFVPGRGIAIAMACNRLLAEEPLPTTVAWQRLLDVVSVMLTEQE